jgi:hypothetical protein
MKHILKGDIMYYIGELSKEGRKGILIELWDGVVYSSYNSANKKIKEIEKMSGRTNLEVIDDRDYNIPRSQGWSEES